MVDDRDDAEVLNPDDPIDGDRARLEARFRDLEREEELRRLRGEDTPPRSSPRAAAADDDDLAGMKAALEDQGDQGAAPAAEERYLMILCPSCDAKNRTSLSRIRQSSPRCGACKRPLWFTSG